MDVARIRTTMARRRADTLAEVVARNPHHQQLSVSAPRGRCEEALAYPDGQAGAAGDACTPNDTWHRAALCAGAVSATATTTMISATRRVARSLPHHGIDRIPSPPLDDSLELTPALMARSTASNSAALSGSVDGVATIRSCGVIPMDVLSDERIRAVGSTHGRDSRIPGMRERPAAGRASRLERTYNSASRARPAASRRILCSRPEPSNPDAAGILRVAVYRTVKVADPCSLAGDRKRTAASDPAGYHEGSVRSMSTARHPRQGRHARPRR